jgi:CheY-like chemotaxis protein
MLTQAYASEVVTATLISYCWDGVFYSYSVNNRQVSEMQKTLVQWHFTPSLEAARKLREKLAQVLDTSIEVQGTMRKIAAKDPFLLACAELIVNLSRYPIPPPKTAQLRFSYDEYYWQLEILDDGPSFNNFSQQLSSTEPLIAAESGMGLKLLAASFDEFFYIPACYRQDAQNVMLLRQRVDQTKAAPKTLLLVDDDVVFRAVINAYLKDDYRIVQASNVNEAFELLLLHKPDLVICDLNMPGADGSILYEMIRPIPDVATTAFVYLSGSTDQQLIARALSRPIDDFMAKPVSKEQLQACVSRVLMRSHYLAQQLQHEFEQKITLGLHPSLPATIGEYHCALRTQLPEAGGGDLVLVHNKHLIFADLMGHGIGAKAFVYALAGYIRGLCAAGLDLQDGAIGADKGCARLLKMVSRGFNQDPVLSETLATLLTLELSDDGVVTFANAGHPQPILCSKDAQSSELKIQAVTVDGPLLGLQLDGYSEQQVQLNEGDRILLFSDGFLDATQALPTELVQKIQLSYEMPLESAADYLLQPLQSSVSACVDAPINISDVDDVTLIVLQWRGDIHRFSL